MEVTENKSQQLTFVLAGMGFFPPSSSSSSSSAGDEQPNKDRQPNNQVPEAENKMKKRVQFQAEESSLWSTLWRNYMNHVIVAIASIGIGILLMCNPSSSFSKQNTSPSESTHVNITHLLLHTLSVEQRFFSANADSESQKQEGKWQFLSSVLPTLKSKYKIAQKTKPTLQLITIKDSYAAIHLSSSSSLPCSYQNDILSIGQAQSNLANIKIKASYVGCLFPSIQQNPMAKFLTSPLLSGDKDPTDWSLGHFQDAMDSTCSEIKKQSQLHSRNGIEVDDMLMPEKLCTMTRRTIGSLTRIGNLLEESMHGQLPVQQYTKPFLLLPSSAAPHEDETSTPIIMVVDASVAQRNPWFLGINGFNVVVVIAGMKSRSEMQKFADMYEPCKCPPSSCMCNFNNFSNSNFKK